MELIGTVVVGFALAALAWWRGYKHGQRETERRWREAVMRADYQRSQQVSSKLGDHLQKPA
jgi:hypothetical protein